MRYPLASFLCIGMFSAFCATQEPVDNIVPLAFGMTAETASAALGAPLAYVRGRPGSETFIADRMAAIPGLYPVEERYSLQFRRGRLSGWKRQWQLRRLFVL